MVATVEGVMLAGFDTGIARIAAAGSVFWLVRIGQKTAKVNSSKPANAKKTTRAKDTLASMSANSNEFFFLCMRRIRKKIIPKHVVTATAIMKIGEYIASHRASHTAESTRVFASELLNHTLVDGLLGVVLVDGSLGVVIVDGSFVLE